MRAVIESELPLPTPDHGPSHETVNVPATRVRSTVEGAVGMGLLTRFFWSTRTSPRRRIGSNG